MERIIKWFISNTVAANMLMFIILVAGTPHSSVKNGSFPDIDIDAVTITVPYPGSSPSDVEEGICFLIEENLQEQKV